jgi:hypothetical protein
MKNLKIQDSIVLAQFRNKKCTTELSLFAEEQLIGQMHYHMDSDSLAGAQVGNSIWILERTGNGFETSSIIVKNVNQTNPLFKIWIDLMGTTTSLELSDGTRVRFRNTCFWSNKWAWVNMDSNEVLIDFNMKAGFSKRGITTIASRLLNNEKTPLLCILGWFILHSIDVNEKRNLELQEVSNF